MERVNDASFKILNKKLTNIENAIRGMKPISRAQVEFIIESMSDIYLDRFLQELSRPDRLDNKPVSDLEERIKNIATSWYKMIDLIRHGGGDDKNFKSDNSLNFSDHMLMLFTQASLNLYIGDVKYHSSFFYNRFIDVLGIISDAEIEELRIAVVPLVEEGIVNNYYLDIARFSKFVDAFIHRPHLFKDNPQLAKLMVFPAEFIKDLVYGEMTLKELLDTTEAETLLWSNRDARNPMEELGRVIIADRDKVRLIMDGKMRPPVKATYDHFYRVINTVDKGMFGLNPELPKKMRAMLGKVNIVPNETQVAKSSIFSK